MRRTDILGHRLHYTDAGDGPVLLLVHAGMWSFIWRDVIGELANDFRCVALDFPGSGLSDAAPGYRASIGALVTQMGLGPVTLVMHDLGAVVGLDFAARNPRAVRALVVAQGFGWWPPPPASASAATSTPRAAAPSSAPPATAGAAARSTT